MRNSRKLKACRNYIVLIGFLILTLSLIKSRSAPEYNEVPSVARRRASYTQDISQHAAISNQRGLVANPLPTCHDQSVECSTWYAGGECDRNPGYMFSSCPHACGGCLVIPVAPRVSLQAGISMPTIGFGTAGLGAQTAQAVEKALRLGYRRIDSAQAREWYREDLVGAGIIAAGLPRKDIFITTKVHPRDFGAEDTKAAVERSLKDLKSEWIDLVLLHYAECWGTLCEGRPPKGSWRDSWHALEALVRDHKIRALGVSNFDLEQLTQLLSEAKVPVSLVQLNSDPLHQNAATQAFCRRKGIQFEGYSSLGGQYLKPGGANPVLNHLVVTEIATLKHKTSSQVVLRWALQQGQTVVPRSSSESHIRDNLNVFDFELTDAEMLRLGRLDKMSSAHDSLLLK